MISMSKNKLPPIQFAISMVLKLYSSVDNEVYFIPQGSLISRNNLVLADFAKHTLYYGYCGGGGGGAPTHGF